MKRDESRLNTEPSRPPRWCWRKRYWRGRGSIFAAVIGAVAGGLICSATEEGLMRTQGVEITVREDDGSMRAYVQQVQENEVFRTGERVKILTVNGTSRVSH